MDDPRVLCPHLRTHPRVHTDAGIRLSLSRTGALASSPLCFTVSITMKWNRSLSPTSEKWGCTEMWWSCNAQPVSGICTPKPHSHSPHLHPVGPKVLWACKPSQLSGPCSVTPSRYHCLLGCWFVRKVPGSSPSGSGLARPGTSSGLRPCALESGKRRVSASD